MEKANEVAKLFLDQVLIKNGVPFDSSEGASRNINMMDEYLRLRTANSDPVVDDV